MFNEKKRKKSNDSCCYKQLFQIRIKPYQNDSKIETPIKVRPTLRFSKWFLIMVNVSLMYIFNKDRGFGRFGKNCDLNPQYLCIALFEFKSDSSFVLSFIDIATSGYLFFGFVAKIEILEK